MVGIEPASLWLRMTRLEPPERKLRSGPVFQGSFLWSVLSVDYSCGGGRGVGEKCLKLLTLVVVMFLV